MAGSRQSPPPHRVPPGGRVRGVLLGFGSDAEKGIVPAEEQRGCDEVGCRRRRGRRDRRRSGSLRSRLLRAEDARSGFRGRRGQDRDRAPHELCRRNPCGSWQRCLRLDGRGVYRGLGNGCAEDRGSVRGSPVDAPKGLRGTGLRGWSGLRAAAHRFARGPSGRSDGFCTGHRKGLRGPGAAEREPVPGGNRVGGRGDQQRQRTGLVVEAQQDLVSELAEPSLAGAGKEAVQHRGPLGVRRQAADGGGTGGILRAPHPQSALHHLHHRIRRQRVDARADFGQTGQRGAVAEDDGRGCRVASRRPGQKAQFVGVALPGGNAVGVDQPALAPVPVPGGQAGEAVDGSLEHVCERLPERLGDPPGRAEAEEAERGADRGPQAVDVSGDLVQRRRRRAGSSDDDG
ncbi:hypothetical protein BX266_5466 [Streptomyces sp. TLI_171]|nr:hypothetical protein BX266_5466 [Streptomyces sp. TLI_171]